MLSKLKKNKKNPKKNPTADYWEQTTSDFNVTSSLAGWPGEFLSVSTWLTW